MITALEGLLVLALVLCVLVLLFLFVLLLMKVGEWFLDHTDRQ